MRITTLALGATNSVFQFDRIVLKILAAYLCNQVLLFLDDVGIKDLQTIYNNEKLALGIKCYVIEHIQNLDKILVDLKQVRIIIANAKSEFC